MPPTSPICAAKATTKPPPARAARSHAFDVGRSGGDRELGADLVAVGVETLRLGLAIDSEVSPDHDEAAVGEPDDLGIAFLAGRRGVDVERVIQRGPGRVEDPRPDRAGERIAHAVGRDRPGDHEIARIEQGDLRGDVAVQIGVVAGRERVAEGGAGVVEDPRLDLLGRPRVHIDRNEAPGGQRAQRKIQAEHGRGDLKLAAERGARRVEQPAVEEAGELIGLPRHHEAAPGERHDDRIAFGAVGVGGDDELVAGRIARSTAALATVMVSGLPHSCCR